jgi:N-acetylglutamate synthase-like GNAT family acetyltransferase
MLTSSDPTILRARAWDHGGRPMASAALARTSLGGVPAITANGLVFVAEQDAPATRAAAEAAGMSDAGTAPLMSLELSDELADGPCAGVERAVDPATVEEVSELIRSAFGIAGATGLRHDLAEVPGADAWLLREHATGRAVAALVATADPDLVGIWSMATVPSRRREGHGTCLLRAVLGHHALEGATTACLITTSAGESLYGSLGFETVEQLQVWNPR